MPAPLKSHLPFLKWHLAIVGSFILCIVDAGISFSVPSPSYFAEWDVKDTFGRAEEAIGNRIGDYTLTDQDGKGFQLKGLLDKPLVISFIYATCDYACPLITTHLRDAVKEAGGDFGKKFRIITISFAPDDTPERMRSFGSNFTDDFENWKFATGDEETISMLARDVGLSYMKADKGFQHLNFFTVVDTEGKVYKHIYGIDFKPKTVLESIDMAIEQKKLWVRFINIMDAMKAFCYTYDAKTGRYVPNFAMLLPVILGAIAQLSIVALLVYIFRRANQKNSNGLDGCRR